jgi:hypothetical protein
MNVWWYLAGAMYVISTMLWLLVTAKLATANPSACLPWFRGPPNRPRGIEWLQMLANGSQILATLFVADGFWRRGSSNPYDILWGVPFAAVVFVVGLAIPYARHNRRVRRTAS